MFPTSSGLDVLRKRCRKQPSYSVARALTSYTDVVVIRKPTWLRLVDLHAAK